VCAGVVPAHGWDYVPEKLFEKVVDSFVVYAGDKPVRIQTKEPFMAIVSRLELGQHQLDLAKKAGADVRSEAKVVGLDQKQNEVKIDGGSSIAFNKLIAADGSNSIIRRSLGFKSGILFNCVKYSIPSDYKDLELYFDLKNFGFIYGGLFPHKGEAFFEIAALTRWYKVSDVDRIFVKWLKKREFDFSEVNKQAAPIYMGYHGFRHGNIFLTGDAASFICTVTGAGIYQAFKSGEIAAKSIINPKWNYRPEIRDLLRHHRMLWWLLSIFNNHPEMCKRMIEKISVPAMAFIPYVLQVFAASNVVKNNTLSWILKEK